jgi:hypothetical protein
LDGCNEFTPEPGSVVGSCPIAPASDSEAWTDLECGVSISRGVHDLCLGVEGAAGAPLFDLDYFSFH